MQNDRGFRRLAEALTPPGRRLPFDPAAASGGNPLVAILRNTDKWSDLGGGLAVQHGRLVGLGEMLGAEIRAARERADADAALQDLLARAGGLLQMGLSLAEAGGALLSATVPEPTFGTKAAALYLAWRASDDWCAGYEALRTGVPRETVQSSLLRSGATELGAPDWLANRVGPYSELIGGVGVGAYLAPRGGVPAGPPSSRPLVLVHMTTPQNAALIQAENLLRGNNYAGPASNASRSGWSLTARTGLPPGEQYVPIPIPTAGEAAFSRVTPIGPFTAWQGATGQHYTARGFLNLQTGEFTRLGINWNQVQWYAIDVAVDGTIIFVGYSTVRGK